MTGTTARRMKKLAPWELRAATEQPAFRQALVDEYHARQAAIVTAGAVVEFVRLGHPCCGVILTVGARAHTVLDVDGREHRVPLEKVVDTSLHAIATSQTRHEMLAALHAVHDARETLKASIDLETLWTVAGEEARPWPLEELAALYYRAEAGPHGTAALFRALAESGFFTREGRAFVPAGRAQAEACRARQRRWDTTGAWLHEAAAWLRGLADGRSPAPPADAGRALALLADHLLHGEAHLVAAEAAMLARLAHFHTRDAVFAALVAAGHWRRDENLDLLRLGAPVDFTPEALAEASRARWRVRRQDLPLVEGRPVFAAGEWGTGHGRACSVRADRYGVTVGIHLASPALLLRPGGAVEREARARGQVLALPDGFIPLLPPRLVDRALLVDGEARPCLTLWLRFTPGYELRAWHFELGRVRVTDTLEGSPAAGAGRRRLLALAMRLRADRAAAGAVIFAGPEVEPRVDGETVALRSVDPSSPGALIDRELALLANAAAGQWCRERGVPGLYRAEAPPAAVLVAPGCFDPVAEHRQRALLPAAVLQTAPAPHAGVGVAVYLPVTGPTRRCADLLMHRQIVQVLRTGCPAYGEADLQALMAETAAARLAAREIERNARRYWLLRWLEGREGATLEATVLERFDVGYLLELSETRLTAWCPAAAPRLSPGAPLRVRLLHADARKDELRLQAL